MYRRNGLVIITQFFIRYSNILIRLNILIFWRFASSKCSYSVIFCRTQQDIKEIIEIYIKFRYLKEI